MKSSGNAIDDYLAALPPNHRSALQRLRSIVQKAYPSAQESIYYGMPAFRLNGKAFVAFRSSKAHCSLHPLSGTVVESLSSELAGFDVSKGTIRFTPEKPLPESLVEAILRRRAQELTVAP